MSILGSLVPKTAETDDEPPAYAGWTVGRSYATRLTATARAGGVCERCGVNPVYQVHHPHSMRGRSHLGKVASDTAQRQKAEVLCRECHEREHAGSS